MLGRLITALAAGEVSEVKQRLQLSIVSYLIMGFMIVMALMFFILAAYIAAAFRWGVLEAAIGFALGFTLLAIIVLVVYKIVTAARKREQRKRMAQDATMLASASAVTALPAVLGKMGGINPILIGLAGLGGYALFRQFNKKK